MAGSLASAAGLVHPADSGWPVVSGYDLAVSTDHRITLAIFLTHGEEKVALAARYGADLTIDHRRGGSVAEQVREFTAGRGADIVCDNVGGSDVRDLLRAMAWNGRYLVVGFAGGEIPNFRANQTGRRRKYPFMPPTQCCPTPLVAKKPIGSARMG